MQGRAQALLLTQHKPPRPHVKRKKQSPKFPASLRSRSQDSSRTCPETEERGPEWEQSCFFSPPSNQNQSLLLLELAGKRDNLRRASPGCRRGWALLRGAPGAQPCSHGSRLHILVRGTEFADKNTARVMLGMEQAGSSCRRLHNIPLLARLQSTKTKQNSVGISAD